MCTFRHLTLKRCWSDDDDDNYDDDDDGKDDANDGGDYGDLPSLHQGVMPVQLPKKHWVVLFPFSMYPSRHWASQCCHSYRHHPYKRKYESFGHFPQGWGEGTQPHFIAFWFFLLQFTEVQWRNLSMIFFAIVFKISRIILFSSTDGWKGREGSDGLLVGVVSGGQRLRAKRIQHSGLSFAISWFSYEDYH